MSGSLCSRIVEDVIVRPAYIPAACVLVEGWNSSMCLSTYSLSNETVSGQLKAAQDMHSP